MSARQAALKLRPYQQEAIEAIERAAERGVKRPLLVLATGLGKTICFGSLIARGGGSAVVLAHRDELLRQAADKIRLAHPELGMAVGFVAASRNDVFAPIVVGSVQPLPERTGWRSCQESSGLWSSTRDITPRTPPTNASWRICPPVP